MGTLKTNAMEKKTYLTGYKPKSQNIEKLAKYVSEKKPAEKKNLKGVLKNKRF